MAAATHTEAAHRNIQAGSSPSMLRVDRPCRLHELALRVFGDPDLAFVLCQLNPTFTPHTRLDVGQRIRVPSPQQAKAMGQKFASQQRERDVLDDREHQSSCLRLVRCEVSASARPISACVAQADRMGCTPIETAKQLVEESPRAALTTFVREPSSTGFEICVKEALEIRLSSDQTRRALRNWCEMLLYTTSPSGWLSFLQAMDSTPTEMCAVLRALGLPDTLILVARRLAKSILARAMEIAAETPAPGMYRTCTEAGESQNLSPKFPLQVSLASGVPLMHSTHLQGWGSDELHRQIARYFQGIRDAFVPVTRDWESLPRSLTSQFTEAYAGERSEPMRPSTARPALELFARLQTLYGKKLEDFGPMAPLGLSALVSMSGQERHALCRPWRFSQPSAPDEPLAHAITQRLATEMIRVIEFGPCRGLSLVRTGAGTLEPRTVRTMLTTSRDVRPDGARICEHLDAWFSTQRRSAAPHRASQRGQTPPHIRSFAQRMERPISTAGRNLSDYGIAVLLAACACSRWESSWMHPQLPDALTESLLNHYAPKVLTRVEEMLLQPHDKNTKAPEWTRGFAYGLRA